ncbi:MAG: hypothetical protein M3R08_08455, partial [Bacteroidota bacterium]|nr:hypothetical protein [Bacteroidota bacterium]
FETVAPEVLDQLGFIYATGSFVDPIDPRTVSFIRKYRETYDTEADDFAFLGFDVTFFYVKALMTRGTNFASSFSQVDTHPISMDFDMRRAGPENGFRNEHAIMLQLKELQLVKAP